MKKYITISREYCSGGHSIGQMVAKELNLPFYDKEIIDMAANESGLSPDFITKTEQSISSGLLYTLLLGASYASPGTGNGRIGIGSQAPTMPLADQVFNAQRKAIIELANKGPCVLVGRCSDYVLRHCEEIDRSEILNVFIYAPIEAKVKYAVEHKGLDAAVAEKEIKLVDKRRANHYNTFTERTWGNRAHYDLLVNSATLGWEKAAKLIVEVAKNS